MMMPITDTEHLNQQLKKLVDFLTPLLPFANSHLINFFVKDQFNTFLCCELRSDILSLQEGELDQLPMARLWTSMEEPESWQSSLSMNLREFLRRIRYLHGDKLGVLTPVSAFTSAPHSEKNRLLLSKAMRSKKAYEVDLFTSLVSQLCKDKSIHHILDIGCGLGYLSSSLTVQHNLNVLAIDSSSTNIKSALKLSHKLKKLSAASNKIEKNDEILDKDDGKIQVEDGKIQVEDGKIQVEDGTAKCTRERSFDDGKQVDFTAFGGKFVGMTKFVEENENISNLLNLVSLDMENHYWSNVQNFGIVGLHTCGHLTPASLKLFCFNPDVSFICNIGCCYHMLQEEFIDDTINLDANTFDLNAEHSLEQSTNKESTESETTEDSVNFFNDEFMTLKLYQVLAKEVKQSRPRPVPGILSLLKEIEEKFRDEICVTKKDLFGTEINNRTLSFDKTGKFKSGKIDCDLTDPLESGKWPTNDLATPFDLSMKESDHKNFDKEQNIKIEPSKQNDQIHENPTSPKQEKLNLQDKVPYQFDSRYQSPEYNPYLISRLGIQQPGFPLSVFLRDMKFALGKNARDLASKPASTLSLRDKGLKTLFWRAVFQKIVFDLGSNPNEARVGRKAKKCKSFLEYCRLAFKNIGFEAKISDETLLSYLRKYEKKEDAFIRFYFLKTSLGPVIENLIHLDRLIFLREQGFTNSHLVQVFDEKISPRCVALLSMR